MITKIKATQNLDLTMEKAVHSRPVSEEDEALSRSRKLRLEGKYKEEEHSEEQVMQQLYQFDSKGEKAVDCSPDITEYTPFTDSRYKLPLYLSEFALVEFNAIQKATYEKVNVLDTMKSRNVDKGTTYLITFEASLPDDMSNNAQTFQTKFFMALLDSTTMIDIKFVRIKLSEFDYNEEEDSKENLSESDEDEEEEEEEEVSETESDEEDSEFDEEDTEEMLSESDEKDTELKLSKSDWKDFEQEKLSEFEEDDSEEEELSESDNKELFEQYRIDLEKSDGFEVGNYPRMKTSCCMIRRYYDPPARTQSTTNLNRLVSLSQLAICVYNMKEDTCFDNVKVLKAMSFGCGRTNYNITFEASLSHENDVTFQTRIYTSVPFPYRKIEIKFVRIKPSINPMDIT